MFSCLEATKNQGQRTEQSSRTEQTLPVEDFAHQKKLESTPHEVQQQLKEKQVVATGTVVTEIYLRLNDERCRHAGGSVDHSLPIGLGVRVSGGSGHNGDVVRRTRDGRGVEQGGCRNNRRGGAVTAPRELHASANATGYREGRRGRDTIGVCGCSLHLIGFVVNGYVLPLAETRRTVRMSATVAHSHISFSIHWK